MRYALSTSTFELLDLTKFNQLDASPKMLVFSTQKYMLYFYLFF